MMQRQRLPPPNVWRGRAAVFCGLALIIGARDRGAIPRGSDSASVV